MSAILDKRCRNNRAFINELYVYESDFPNKPKLIEVRQPRTLVLSKIEGVPYLDVPELTDEMVIKLAKVIGKLHSLAKIDEKVLCHWDNQPRNILWDEKKKKIFLLDFEDIRFAPPEADLAHLFLFWAEMMNSDEFSHRITLFLKCYTSTVLLNRSRWRKAIRNTISRFNRRRKKFGKPDLLVSEVFLQNRTILLNQFA